MSAEGGGGGEGKGKLINNKSNNISGQMSMNLKLQQFFSMQTLINNNFEDISTPIKFGLFKTDFPTQQFSHALPISLSLFKLYPTVFLH